MNNAICIIQLFVYLGVISFSICTIAAARSEATPLGPPKEKRALVVGVGHYEQWPVLPNAVADAREIAFLLENGGYEVTLLIDPAADQLRNALSVLVNETGITAERSIIFYYTGQGETQPIAEGKNAGYIIPRDCPRRRDDPKAFRQKALSTSQFVEFSEKMNARQVLMIFDTSFAGDLFALSKPSLRLPGATSNLPIRQYIIAGGAHEPIPDRSIFSKYLNRGLTGEADAVSDNHITASELAVYLSQQMVRSANGQHLQYALHPGAKLAGGDFILHKIKCPGKVGRLYVDTQPQEATVRILNIRPKFKQGIDLDAAKYQVSVSADGFRTQTKWVTLPGGKTQSLEMYLDAALPQMTNSLGMDLRWIDSGSFYMGKSTNDAFFVDNESPHTVSLTQGLYIQTTEVTVDQFSRFVKATNYRTAAERTGCWTPNDHGGWSLQKEVDWRHPAPPPEDKTSAGRMPVTCVSWQDAQAFVHWLGGREGKSYCLPSESQWEYACRATSVTAFAFGQCLSPSQANYGRTGPYFKKCTAAPLRPPAPMTVGLLEANAWGLFDMHGNVAEWCRDWYGPYPERTMRDPTGPYQGVEKVFRGGHFLSQANECRSSRRLSFPPDQAASVIGFRVVMQP